MLAVGGNGDGGLGQGPGIAPAGAVTSIAVGIPLRKAAARGSAQDKNLEHVAMPQSGLRRREKNKTTRPQTHHPRRAVKRSFMNEAVCCPPL